MNKATTNRFTRAFGNALLAAAILILPESLTSICAKRL